jgi:hypothetical protein
MLFKNHLEIALVIPPRDDFMNHWIQSDHYTRPRDRRRLYTNIFGDDTLVDFPTIREQGYLELQSTIRAEDSELSKYNYGWVRWPPLEVFQPLTHSVRTPSEIDDRDSPYVP